MTLPLNSRLSALYDTNGTQKDFSFGFRVFFDPDNGGYGLEVRRQTADGYEVIPKSDYLVLPVEDNSAGVVRFNVAPSAGQQIYIAGKTPTIQQLVLTNFGRYSAESIETQFDFITAIIQEWLSALGEETRQRIAADNILTQYVVQRIDDFVQQVNQNWDDKSQEIEGYIATIMPSFTQTLRDEIEAFAVAGMQDAINQTLAESKSEIDDAVARANAATLAAAITGKVYDTPEAGVDPVTGVQIGAYYNVRSPDDDSYLVEYQNIGGVPTPSGKAYPSVAALNAVKESIIDPVTGMAVASKVFDKNGKNQQEINDRKLYFSDFIDSLDGSTFVDTHFIEAITAANGREIILQKDEIIRLTGTVNLGSLNVNIVGEGGLISIEHSEQGVVTSGNVSLSGVIDIDCNKLSWCALDCTGAGSKVYIGNNVKIKNVYGVNSGIAFRSRAKVNSIHASFDDISALANGTVGDGAGVVRCIYLAGPKSKSIISGNFNNVYNVNGSGVRVDEDADAIQCQNGVHDILLYDADFRNVDKRWLKLQGHAGSRAVVKNITGSSAFIGTPDNISASQNGLYACMSLYGGTLEVDGVTYEGGSCFAFLTVGTSLATKVSLTNIQYHPEYHNYVQGLVTRFVLSEVDCDNLDISMTPSVYASAVHLGIDLLRSTVALNVAGSTISSASTAIASRAKNTTVHSTKLSKAGGTSGAGYAINIGADVEVANVFDNIISGDFQDGVLVPTRTTPLYGQIAGNNAPNVTRSAVQLNDLVNTARLIMFGNIGPGTGRTNMIADSYMFKNKDGIVLASVGSTGMTFNFESASVATLSSATTAFNTSNKRVGRPVLNTTDNKLYLATGDTPTSTWVSVDGVTTITPV